MEAQIKKLCSVISTLIALQIVTVAAVIGMTWYSHKELKEYVSVLANASRPPNTPQNVENWEAFVRAHNATHGVDAAPVYSDFQCPFCKRYNDETRSLIMAEFGQNVRTVFKHYPLESHPHAMTAAIASQCAQREGRFWDVHDQFFNQPNALDLDSVIAVGESLGLSEGYAHCVRTEETRSEVEQDIRDAREVGVQATPTFMINGQFLVGAQSVAAFRAAFEEVGLIVD
jgi:protein-disulfide isomerase